MNQSRLHGFAVVLEAATRAARGFLQPSHATSEKACENANEGKNLLPDSNKVIVSCLVIHYCFDALGFISYSWMNREKLNVHLAVGPADC